MGQFAFGSGSLWGVRTDNVLTVTNTPLQFGVIQDGSVEFSHSIKQLMGQYQYPVAIGRGSGKITAKAKFAKITGRIYSDLFFGTTFSSDEFRATDQETGTIPGTPYQITVAHSTYFTADLGVINVATGLYMLKVASGPTTGQYSVSAGGVYTFAAADTTLAVLISYAWTRTTGLGNKIIVTNQLLGTTPTFMAVLQVEWDSSPLTIRLNKCVATKLNFASKLEDFIVPEFDFEAMADSSNVIGTIGTIQ
jgi:hypothetical protein